MSRKGVASSALFFTTRMRPFCCVMKRRPSPTEVRSLGAFKPLAICSNSIRTGPPEISGKSGVGDGLGLGLGLALGLGDAEGEGEGLAEGLGEAEGEGLGEGDAEGLGDGEAEGLGDGVGEGDPATTVIVPIILQQPP